ncbi:hypothetical protein EIN_183470 [Entamoeba invadens IP1]|nr:hypothetical protein EIN_183470 [Entamoeba invadens IP1]ELP94060.1 hypothetical protein EIN_183470 [Entamoeba invadens IP1]|eukprot:XP_004260831.1 hypothetical protein EIN_183470 [Entamoeba invadens IP1]
MLGALSQPIPKDLVAEIQTIKNKQIKKITDLDNQANDIEKKMDELFNQANKIRLAKTKAKINDTLTRADNIFKNQTENEVREIDNHWKQFSNDTSKIVENQRKVAGYTKKNYLAQKKLLKFLKQQVVKENAALEEKRKQMKIARENEIKELKTIQTALRIAKMKGMAERAKAEEERHTMLHKAAEEEKLATLAEIAEKKKTVKMWKRKIQELIASEKEHHRVLDEIELAKRNARITQTRKEGVQKLREKEQQAARTSQIKAMIRRKMEKERLQKFNLELFKRRCEALKKAYNKKPKKLVHLCIPQSNIKLMGKMRKCLPIWKEDLPNLKQKLDTADKYRVKIAKKSTQPDPQIELIVPVY